MYGLGYKIRTARKAKRYTQEQLAKKIGKSRAIISSYECDMKTPSGETLIELAAALDVSLDYLTGIASKQTVVVDTLTEGQIESVIQLVTEYREGRRFPGFTPHQQRILNRIMDEFGKLPKGKE